MGQAFDGSLPNKEVILFEVALLIDANNQFLSNRDLPQQLIYVSRIFGFNDLDVPTLTKLCKTSLSF